jgi:hypothetical protein
LNAQDYAELIVKILSTFQYLENRPRFPYTIKIPKDNPSFLRWKEKIPLQENLCLSVNETAIFDDDKMTERIFAYDFRHIDTDKMIWRIDNHSTRQSITSPCHVHPNPENEEERNEFFSDSQGTDFPYVMRCVRKFYEQERQDWEVDPDDTTE